MQKKERGALTVEAAIVLPIFILTLVFFLNFLNIFYLQLTVQQGLNNAGTVLGQYCYAVDLLGDLDKLTLTSETSEVATGIETAMTGFQDNLTGLLGVFSDSITLDTISTACKNGAGLVQNTKNLGSAIKKAGKDEVVNYLFASATEAGGGMLVERMVEEYLGEMAVNRNFLDGKLHYDLSFFGEQHDLLLTVTYRYQHPMLSVFIDHIDMKQSVVVHPWIGGKTEGIRGK